MPTQDQIDKLIAVLEDTFGVKGVSLSKYSTLQDFDVDEFSITIFIFEFEHVFDIDLSKFDNFSNEEFIKIPLFDFLK